MLLIRSLTSLRKKISINRFSNSLTARQKGVKCVWIKAKVGPQIVTLITEKNVYDVIVPKKTVKVELSGLYLVNVVGVNLQDKKKKTWRERAMLFVKSDPKKEAEKIAKK